MTHVMQDILFARPVPDTGYVCIEFYVGSCKDLNVLLGNTHLQKILEEIDRSSTPQRLLEKAMSLPLFREFADKCLSHCRKYSIGHESNTEKVIPALQY